MSLEDILELVGRFKGVVTGWGKPPLLQNYIPPLYAHLRGMGEVRQGCGVSGDASEMRRTLIHCRNCLLPQMC